MALHRSFRTDQAGHKHSSALHDRLLAATGSPDLFHAQLVHYTWVRGARRGRTLSKFKTPHLPEER